MRFITVITFFQVLLFNFNCDASVRNFDTIDTFDIDNFQNVILHHKVNPGFFHKSGTLDIQGEKNTKKMFKAIFNYTITPRLLVPFPKKFRKGTYVTYLPIEFFTKEGYELLAKKKILKNEQATLKFIGFVNVENLKDVYKFQVFPKSSKWNAILYYHPTIKGLGWIKTELTINKIPLIGKYTLKTQLIDLR